MARIDNLTNFLTDVADAIRSKKGTEATISASNFDTEIESIDTFVGSTTTVNPTTSQQVITPTSPSNGFTQVTVNAVDNTIDANIVQGNIKDGVTILGVTGNLTELKGETKTVTPTTSQQTITPSSDKNGITEVTVEAVDSTIDGNIISGNIKDGVTILGVTGTYSPSISLPIDVHATGMKCTNNYLTTLDGTFDLSSIDDTDLARGIFEDCTTLTGFVDDDPNEEDEWHYITNILHSQNSGKSPNFCKGLFKGCENLDCNFDYNNSPQFYYSSGNPYFDLSYMFYNCTSLTTVPQLFNISSYVKDISYMLYNCYNLRWDYDPLEPSPLPGGDYNQAYVLIHSFSAFDGDKLEDWKGFIEGVSTSIHPTVISSDVADEILTKFQNIRSDTYYGSPLKCTLKYLGVDQINVSLFTSSSFWNVLSQHGWTTGYEV